MIDAEPGFRERTLTAGDGVELYFRDYGASKGTTGEESTMV